MEVSTAENAAAWSLAEALRLDVPSSLAIVGAGGKTTALFNLARSLQARFDRPVLVTTTTHLAQSQLLLADICYLVETPPIVPMGPIGYDGHFASLRKVILFHGGPTGDGRVVGLAEDQLLELQRLAQTHGLPLLIEADGARGLPLKAPAAHEPAISPFVEAVLVSAGWSGLGQPLDEANVHRPQRFADLSGLALGDPVTPSALARVLLHPLGGLKNIPPSARKFLLLNQLDAWPDESVQRQVAELALGCLDAYSTVLAAALASNRLWAAYENHAGIILAAGQAQRFGSPKQLLDWQGEPLVRRAVRLALSAGLRPVRVVLGAWADQVRPALSGLPVEIVENPAWQDGQSSSVRAGLDGLPEWVGGAFFLLSDQPHVPVELVCLLRARHAYSRAKLVAPLCGGRRANPVLFDRDTFPLLRRLQGDTGGRVLFERPELSTAWVLWNDPALLFDVDTPADYWTSGAGGGR